MISHEGIHASTYGVSRELMQRSMREKVSGCDVSIDELQHGTIIRQARKFQMLCQHPPTISDIPSVEWVATTISSRARGKGAGEDGIPYEAWAISPKSSAALLHRLYLKALLRVQQPLPWKGGQLTDVLKGRFAGLSTDFRQVMISDGASKMMHTWLRARALDQTMSGFPDNTFAGLPGKGADLCAHFGLTVWENARVSRLSTGTLFVDMKAAFDSVVRQILFSPEQLGSSDMELCYLLHTLKLPHDAADMLVELAAGPHYISGSGVLRLLPLPWRSRTATPGHPPKGCPPSI